MPRLRQLQQAVGDGSGGLLLVRRQVPRLHQCLPVGRIIGVVKTVLGVGHGLPCVNPVFINAVVIGLEPLAGRQLHIRDQEIQLKPSLVPMFNPQGRVLVSLKAREQGFLEPVHQLALRLRRQVPLGKAQAAAGVLLGVG